MSVSCAGNKFLNIFFKSLALLSICIQSIFKTQTYLVFGQNLLFGSTLPQALHDLETDPQVLHPHGEHCPVGGRGDEK